MPSQTSSKATSTMSSSSSIPSTTERMVSAGRFTHSQLLSIRARVEDAVFFWRTSFPDTPSNPHRLIAKGTKSLGSTSCRRHSGNIFRARVESPPTSRGHRCRCRSPHAPREKCRLNHFLQRIADFRHGRGEAGNPRTRYVPYLVPATLVQVLEPVVCILFRIEADKQVKERLLLDL